MVLRAFTSLYSFACQSAARIDHLRPTKKFNPAPVKNAFLARFLSYRWVPGAKETGVCSLHRIFPARNRYTCKTFLVFIYSSGENEVLTANFLFFVSAFFPFRSKSTCLEEKKKSCSL